jgi:hypothetical protein
MELPHSAVNIRVRPVVIDRQRLAYQPLQRDVEHHIACELVGVFPHWLSSIRPSARWSASDFDPSMSASASQVPRLYQRAPIPVPERFMPDTANEPGAVGPVAIPPDPPALLLPKP